MPYKIFTDEIIQEANAIGAALIASGTDIYAEGNIELYDRKDALTEKCVDALIEQLVEIQARAGLHHEPLTPYFLIPIASDDAVRSAIESQGIDYNTLMQKIGADIIQNYGGNVSVAPLLGPLATIETISGSDLSEVKQRLNAYFNGFSRSLKTMSLQTAIENAITEPNHHAFEQRIFTNLVRNFSSGSVVAKVFIDSGVNFEF